MEKYRNVFALFVRLSVMLAKHIQKEKKKEINSSNNNNNNNNNNSNNISSNKGVGMGG